LAGTGQMGQIPFANTLYGIPQPSPYPQSLYPQQSPIVSQQYPASYPNWQQTQQQLAALQHHALQQLLAQQLAAQQLGAQIGAQNFSGAGAMAGFSNGAVGPGTPQQAQQQHPHQQHPHQQQPHQHLLQQLAQYHYLIAQQISQLAAQQAFQPGGGAYSGQFIPGQLGSSYQPGSNYLPGGTMH
jgi:hypothetical protein